MRAKGQGAAEDLLKGRDDVDAVLRSFDWSQTPIGNIETWSDSLKAAMQNHLVELSQVQPPHERPAPSEALSQDGTLSCASSIAVPQTAQVDAFRARSTLR